MFQTRTNGFRNSISNICQIICVLGACLTLTGCGKSSSSRIAATNHPLPSPPLISKGRSGEFGGRFVLSSPAGPKTFNPLLALDNSSDQIVRLLFSSLVRFDQHLQEPGPGLAESWSVDSDQKTWTFRLRQGLRWSDGQPLTADDVAFTWNAIMYNPQFNQVTYGLFQVGGKDFIVTNLDTLTVRVVTPEIYAPFIEFFGTVPILPRHSLQLAVQQRNFLSAFGLGTSPQRIVGSGPFRVKEVSPGKFTLLERNPEYWVVDSQGRRLPYFGEVLVNVHPVGSAEPEILLNGKIDACDTIKPEQFTAFKKRATRNVQPLEIGIGAERDFLWFNQNTGTNAAGQPLVPLVKLKWFRSKQFRQAVSCAIDRERLVKQAYDGLGQAAYGFLSTENRKWNNPNVARYDFNPDRARALLGEVGMRQTNADGVLQDADKNVVEILLISNFGNMVREKTAALIQEDLKRVGIKLVYLPVPFEVLRTKVDRTFDYECALMGLGGGGVDPATQMNVLCSTEELHQWFPFQKVPSTDWEARIDALMNLQMRTLEFSERKKSFDEVQAILAEELPMIYTVSPFACAAIRQDLGNVRPSVLSPYRVTWNLDELYFKK